MYIIEKLNVMLEYISVEEKNYYCEQIFNIFYNLLRTNDTGTEYNAV
jgi:hypothetical protein